ncbi:UNVERIFIED_CONTAM: hypothetical protein HDU68_000402 [Siphonaria sp. JEL0065]|nr:hypothetical protein HDU68_000402 [Siphonaria sp. JEL0065]
MSRKYSGSHQVHIMVEATAQLSNSDLTDADIRKIGRSGSISDRGILELFDNELRRDVIKNFHRTFVRGQSASSRGDTYDAPEYVDAAYSLGKWSLSRYRRLLSQLKEKSFQHVPDNDMLYHIESLQFAMDAESFAQDEHGEEEERRDMKADQEVWTRFAIPIKGCLGVIPELDEDSKESESNRRDFEDIRSAAICHFREMITEDFQALRSTALYSALYLLPKFKIGHIILEMIMPIVVSKVSDFILEDEIIPRLAVLNVIQTENKCSEKFLDSLILVAKDKINKNTVNSILEYSAHTQKSDCVRIVIDNLGDKITSEGVVTSFIPAAMRGVDHFLALLELYVMDRAMQAQLNTELEIDHDDPYSEDPKHFMDFLAPSCYIFIFLAAAAGRAHPSTVVELIEFYGDPCAAYMPEAITVMHHTTFIAQTFHCVCNLNLSTIAWALVEKGWVPKDINNELKAAVELGHQNIVHLLLESLLKPDEKMNPSCLPLVYRKSEALSLLPLVSKRFPREASWFLEQLSCIPIPGCVPCGPNVEPASRAQPVHGVRLGTLNLQDAIFFKRQLGTQSVRVWPRLVMNGMLKQAGSGKDDIETESIICAGPESLLTADAVHTPLFGKSWAPSTSPFIRLLAEDNPQITLQPVMRALMEFHWSRGKFWLRFAMQFAVWSVYVPCLATVCIAVVQLQNSEAAIPYTLPEYVFPLSYLVAFLSCFFIFQELRELHDYPAKYFHSASNIVDTGIHFTILYVVIVGLHMGQYVEPILMSLMLIFCALRIISHLRVLPSVGPLVRLWVTASVNILPILIPYGVMALGFTIAFHIIEHEASREENGISVHFNTIGVSLQSVLTMAMTDYSVLDYYWNPQVFLIRFLFYVCFIIFLVNIIIALMTVNVADIHSNMNAAWLLEIAGIMVDLELFWPYPARYVITGNNPPEKFHLDVQSKRRGKVYPSANDYDDADEPGSPEFMAQLQNKAIVLYTWPQEFVTKTAWWPLMTCRALENSQLDDFDTPIGVRSVGNGGGGGNGAFDGDDRAGGGNKQQATDEHYEPPEPTPAWETILSTIGFGMSAKAEKRQSQIIDLDDVPGLPPLTSEFKDKKIGKVVLAPIGKEQQLHPQQPKVAQPVGSFERRSSITMRLNVANQAIHEVDEVELPNPLSFDGTNAVAAADMNQQSTHFQSQQQSGIVLNKQTDPALRKISVSDVILQQQQSQQQPLLQQQQQQQSNRHSLTHSGDNEGKKVSNAGQNNNNNNISSSVSAIGSQRSGITGTRRPSVWTTLMGSASGSQQKTDSKANESGANVSGTSLLSTGVSQVDGNTTSLVTSTAGGAGGGAGGGVGGGTSGNGRNVVDQASKIQSLSNQLDVIADGLRSMEKFIRQESKTSRERIKRLEDLVETEMKNADIHGSRQREDLAKLTVELGRVISLLEAPSTTTQPQSRRTSVAVQPSSHLLPYNNH